MLERNISLLRFARTLSAHYSNQDQAKESPRLFAHINIYFCPLPWKVLGGPGFYSEQSYDYSPWTPYRQSLHRLKVRRNIYVIENYKIWKPERVAGAGIHHELINDIDTSNLKRRVGCSMHFKEKLSGQYEGKVEPGNNCIINREGRSTYLISKVTFNQETWTSLDIGYDAKTNKHSWGSEHGDLIFKRIRNIGESVTSSWEANLM